MAEKPTVMAVQKALESAKKRNFTETVELAINLKDVDLSMPKKYRNSLSSMSVQIRLL